MVIPSIDFLTLKESGKYDPLYGGSVIRLDENDHPLSERLLSMSIEGSHSTACRARVQNSEREMSWNPSRFSREDNCLGISIEHSLLQADRLMKQYDQPPWRAGTLEQYQDGTPYWKGTQLKRLDLAVMLMLGNPVKAQEFMRHFYRTKLTNNQPQRRGETVYHGSLKRARGKTIKAYPKGLEILAHAKKTATPYQKKLADYCVRNGLVRLEIRYGSVALENLGLRGSEAVNSERLNEIFSRELSTIMAKITNENIDLSSLSREMRGTYYCYMAGEKVKESMSIATFYRHRKAIQKATGFDIANDNVVQFKQKLMVIQPVFVTPEMMPEWYRHPIPIEAAGDENEKA